MTDMEVVGDGNVEGAKQGKVTGLIIPPPDIRAVVDKTAAFVAKLGKSFEEKILNSAEGKTAKFNFMKPFDPYHPFYESRINDFESGKATAGAPAAAPAAPAAAPAAPAPAAPAAVTTTTTTKASIMTPIAKHVQNKLTSAPPAFEFSTLGHPTGLSAVDIDIMKLSAQYTAINGREFLGPLAIREQRNPQFDFLKPTHMLFNYFTTLVDAYSKILRPTEAMLSSLNVLTLDGQSKGDEAQDSAKQQLNKAKNKVLEKCVQRWEWTRCEEMKKQRETEELTADRNAYLSIDWSDFVVVETIDFAQNEVIQHGVVPLAPAPAGAAQNAPPPPPAAMVAESDEDMDMDMSDDDEESAPVVRPVTQAQLDEEDLDIKVVAEYVPRTSATTAQHQDNMMVDPITGQKIRASEMSEHMRVQLMDPRWKAEQQKFQAKQQETGFAEGSSIIDSLSQFAKRRGDIFGSAADDERALQQEEQQRQQRVAETNQIIMSQHSSASTSSSSAPVVTSGQTTVVPQFATDLSGIGPTAPSLSAPTYVVNPLSGMSNSSSDVTGVKLTTSVPAVGSSLPSILPYTSLPLPAPVPVAAAPISLPVSSLSSIPPPTPQPMPVLMPVAPPPPMAMPLQQQHTFIPQEDPVAKKPKVADASTVVPVVDEAAVVALYDGVTLTDGCQVSVCTDGNNPSWGLVGQITTIKGSSFTVRTTIKQLKEILSAQLSEGGVGSGVPISKFQLKDRKAGVFLKDNMTLAAYNLYENNMMFDMHMKTRGGKR